MTMQMQVDTFKVHCSIKAQMKKVLEEVAELYGAAEYVAKCQRDDEDVYTDLFDHEWADAITALCNLFRRVHGDDEEELNWIADDALEFVRHDNVRRGRYQ